jgi:hypothetical protein
MASDVNKIIEDIKTELMMLGEYHVSVLRDPNSAMLIFRADSEYWPNDVPVTKLSYHNLALESADRCAKIIFHNWVTSYGKS